MEERRQSRREMVGESQRRVRRRREKSAREEASAAVLRRVRESERDGRCCRMDLEEQGGACEYARQAWVRRRPGPGVAEATFVPSGC
jgi:hypothetical protein